MQKIGFVIKFQVHLCVPTTIPNQVIFSSMGEVNIREFKISNWDSCRIQISRETFEMFFVLIKCVKNASLSFPVFDFTLQHFFSHDSKTSIFFHDYVEQNQWTNVFSGLVSRAMTLEVLSTGVAGNYNGALQVVCKSGTNP